MRNTQKHTEKRPGVDNILHTVGSSCHVFINASTLSYSDASLQHIVLSSGMY